MGMAYDKQENATWETSDLREWLNSDFLASAFSKHAAFVPSNGILQDSGYRIRESFIGVRPALWVNM